MCHHKVLSQVGCQGFPRVIMLFQRVIMPFQGVPMPFQRVIIPFQEVPMPFQGPHLTTSALKLSPHWGHCPETSPILASSSHVENLGIPREKFLSGCSVDGVSAKGFPGPLSLSKVQLTAEASPTPQALPQGSLWNLKNAGSAGMLLSKPPAEFNPNPPAGFNQSSAQGWCISQQSFLSLFHKLLPVNILSAFPFGTGIVGAPDLTCPCPQSHLCLSAGFKEQEDHVCCCKIGFFFSPPWQRDPEAPVTQRSSQSSALLLGTSLGYTKAQLPQGNTQQFPPNFLSPHIYKDSFAIIPRQFPLDCAHPLAFHQGQSLLATEKSKKRGKLREFSLSFLCCSHQGTEYRFYLWLCFNLNIFLVLLPVAMSFPA